MKDVTEAGSGGALLVEGIVAGTPIATVAGWRPVETLRAGDRVLTTGDGAQPLAAVRRSRLGALPAPPALWPLCAPAGVIGTAGPVLLLPDQRLLIRAGGLAAGFDEPEVLVPAAAFEGWRGIVRHCASPGLAVLTLEFAAPQVVRAGATLRLACPGRVSQNAIPGAGPPSLSLGQARHLVACLMAQDLGRLLRSRM
jgi:hypothetical protein